MQNFNESIDARFNNETIQIEVSKAQIGDKILKTEYKNLMINVLLANADMSLLSKLYSASQGFLKIFPFKVGDFVFCENSKYLYDFQKKRDLYTNFVGKVIEFDELKEYVKIEYIHRDSENLIKTGTMQLESFNLLKSLNFEIVNPEFPNDAIQNYNAPVKRENQDIYSE